MTANSQLKKIEVIWGHPEPYDPPSSRQSRKVKYLLPTNVKMDEIKSKVLADIATNKWLKDPTDIKIFDNEGNRLTTTALILNEGVYYAHWKFPKVAKPPDMMMMASTEKRDQRKGNRNGTLTVKLEMDKIVQKRVTLPNVSAQK